MPPDRSEKRLAELERGIGRVEEQLAASPVPAVDSRSTFWVMDGLCTVPELRAA